jgi:hypothetical protein
VERAEGGRQGCVFNMRSGGSVFVLRSAASMLSSDRVGEPAVVVQCK